MKPRTFFSIPILLMGLIVFFSNSCKKDDDNNALIPVLETIVVSDITRTTATSGGSITSDGGETVTARGVCWSTAKKPTTADSKTTDGTGKGEFSSSLTDLNSETTYYVRAYATNSAGTAYGNEVSFTTLKGENYPILSTVEITSITETSAVSGGEITHDGEAKVTARGVCWSTAKKPTTADSKTTDGTGKGEFSSSLTDLNSETTYYVRAYATNSAGTSYGNELSFTTLKGDNYPVLSTAKVTNITETAAVSGGDISDDNGAEVTARGICWSTNKTPTIADNKIQSGKGTGSFLSSMAGLKVLTTYYVRAYATNSNGTGYGNTVSFTTDGVADADGNAYATVKIGTQQWMTENLKTTKYKDGTNIIEVTDNTVWGNQEMPAYCWYNNDDSHKETYGALYNWYAVETGKLCPTGWHVPTDAEWQQLIEYVEYFGSKLKATSGWKDSGNGTDDYGFSALPGGSRYHMDGSFFNLGATGNWWTSTEYNDYAAWHWVLDKRIPQHHSEGKKSGRSVRCIID